MHTPGPWFVEQNKIWHEQGMACIAEIFSDIVGKEVGQDAQQANARLIAAAPELLEALDNAAEEFEAAAHVIACRMKKRGYDDATLREIGLAINREAAKARAAIAKAKAT